MNKKGATLIEVLVSLAIVSFFVVTIYLALSSMVANIGESKQRVGAIAIANEKMEIIRNLDYKDVGLVDGIISGPILPFETVVRNDFEYRVFVDIKYVDDDLDGTGGDDLINTDYKLVEVDVKWDHFDSTKSVQFVSNVVPDGIETDMGGGSLVLNTMTSGGDIVGNVDINLNSIEDAPSVNYNTSTDNNGSLILQGVPSQNYRITLSKDGYEEVRTYPNSPESSFDPRNPDFYVTEGYLNSKNFYINLNADLKIKAIEAPDGLPVSDLSVELKGGQLIGTEPDTYNLNNLSSTDSLGEIDYLNVSPGFYDILNKDTLGFGDYDFVGTVAETSFNLLAGENKTVELVFADENEPALFLEVVDSVTQEPVQDAIVALAGPSEFDQDSSTGENGATFFPVTSDPQVYMENAEYTLEIRKSDYSDYSEIITVTNLTKKKIELNPI